LAGNSIGREFVVTCFGESHGKCVGVVTDGCPAGLPLSERDFQKELDERKPIGTEIFSTRRERDIVEVLSGTFSGMTTGAPICTLVWNKEVMLDEYDLFRDTPRPGHADYPAQVRYGGFNDYRGGGRFSGRITVAFVMAGAIAKKLLSLFGVEIVAYTVAIGKVKLRKKLNLEEVRRNTYTTTTRCPDGEGAKDMENEILKARSQGDSVGGAIECVAWNVPVGIGEPLFNSLDADIAKILFDIPAVKGVEFGVGFGSARLRGSENNDPYVIRGQKVVTLTNNAGGILGGLSTGMPISVRVAIKPTPSISKEQKTVNLSKKEETLIRATGRHDSCIVPKAVKVVESVVAIVLVDNMLGVGLIPKVLGGQD
jgi:chorismate synthase